MYCPECGTDAGEARYRPECGENLAGVKEAMTGKPAAKAAKSGPDGAADKPPAAPQVAAPGGSPRPSLGRSGALAIVVVIVVIMVSGGFGGGSADSGAGSADQGEAVPAVEADTSGSYEELVQRANELYDQGDAAFQEQGLEQGSA